MIDCRQLSQFVMVARHMSYSKAASMLYLSHSTISRNVSMLEKSLHTKLISRDNKVISLTPMGKLLYEEGDAILKQLVDLEKRVGAMGVEVHGRLRVAGLNIASSKMAELSDAFRRKCPSVSYSIDACRPDEVISRVLSDEADVGMTFSYMQPGMSQLLRYKELETGEFCLLCSSRNWLAGFEEVSLSDLHGTRLVTVPYNWDGFGFVEPVLEKYLDPSMKRMQGYSVESINLQVMNNIGVALLPYHLAEMMQTGCRIIRLKEQVPYNIVLVWNGNSSNTVLPKFLELI